MAKDEIYTDDEMLAFDMQAEPEVVAKKGIGEKIGDAIFNLMRRKKHEKKNEKKNESVRAVEPDNVLFEDTISDAQSESDDEKLSYEITGTGVVIPEDADLPFLFPRKKQSKKYQLLSTCLALVTFAAGTIITYTQLPTHAELVLGIIMIVISGHILLAYAR